MTVAYVFTAGDTIAITVRTDGSNLPPPKLKGASWKAIMRVSEASESGLAGFDPRIFQSQGYQILKADDGKSRRQL
jgi:hypothetical protein